MNLIHFFTLGFFPEYIVMGIILGILIGIYTLFRVKYALNDSNLSKNKQIIISSIIAILSFLFCLNIWSMGAILIFYLFISSLIADLIRIIQKYLIKEKHLNFIPIIHKKGLRNNNNSTPGNYEPVQQNPNEQDDDNVKVVITPPTGLPLSKIHQ